MNNMENLANSEIKREFHKLIVSQWRKPKISLETETQTKLSFFWLDSLIS